MSGDPYSCGEKVDTDDFSYKLCSADCLVLGVSYNLGGVTKGCDVYHCTTHREEWENDTHAIGLPFISIVLILHSLLNENGSLVCSFKSI